MITKAIVEDASDRYSVKVRIPFYDRASVAPRRVLDEDLPQASICTLPNSGLNVRKGDIVFVSFEDDDIGRPVIVGCLYTDKVSDTGANIFAETLRVATNAKLPKSTSIGDVSSKELQRLKGVSDNIQGQIDALQTNVDNKSTLYAHKVSFYVSSCDTQVFVNLLTGDKTELTASDFIDSSNHGVPQTFNKVINSWGYQQPDHGHTWLGVSIMFAIDYSESAGDWRGVVMSMVRSDDTVDTIELQQSDLDSFSDTVTPI